MDRHPRKLAVYKNTATSLSRKDRKLICLSKRLSQWFLAKDMTSGSQSQSHHLEVRAWGRGDDDKIRLSALKQFFGRSKNWKPPLPAELLRIASPNDLQLLQLGNRGQVD